MTPPTLPEEVVKTMASREHRLHHWLWHEVRNSWLSYPEDVRKQIRDLGWEPPRPALNERRRPILDNDSGEDFLYMHRQMLIEVSWILNRVKDPGYPRVRVWSVPPPPGDADFPVPPASFDPTVGEDEKDRRVGFETIQRIKSDIFYQKRMLYWQKLFTDHGFLRDISLGELGTLMELSMHASMHVRWASPPAGSRPEPGPTEGHTIDRIWDDPRYDFLGDTYSSHVHPVFWSLHGWIDDRIEDWKIANGVYGDKFWKGTWTGPWPGEAPLSVPGPPTPGAAPPSPPVSGAPPAEQGAVAAPAVTAPAPEPVSHPSALPHGRPAHAGRSERAPGVAPTSQDQHHADLAQLEEVVTIIGRCGIFHAGYASVLTRPTG